MSAFQILLVATLYLVASVVDARLTSGVQCLSEGGSPVDWWFVYKMPNGFNYAYYDSTQSSGKLVPASGTLDCTSGCALGNTLHQLYAAKTSLAHVLYNDEPLGGNSQTSSGPNGGHVKGVMAADSNGGFWLIHSVPKFPDLAPPKFTWTASTIYGQSFLCVSLNSDGIESAATELQYMDPNIYDSSIPTALKSTYPEMTALYGGTRQKGSSVVTITSSGGTKFTHFAKDNSWGKDLYDDLVEPTLKQAFQWETWRRSPFLPSLCTTQYDTLNVASISLGSFQFSYTQDHSKWGVSLKGTWACVGGINRMQSQRARGGGTMCFSNSQFWKALTGVVASSEPCATSSVRAVQDSNDDETPQQGGGGGQQGAFPSSPSSPPASMPKGRQGKIGKQPTVIKQGPGPRHHGHPGSVKHHTVGPVFHHRQNDPKHPHHTPKHTPKHAPHHGDHHGGHDGDGHGPHGGGNRRHGAPGSVNKPHGGFRGGGGGGGGGGWFKQHQ